MTEFKHGRNGHSHFYLAVAAVALVAGLSWFFWPPKQQLSPDSYKLTIALYRVCNQQDLEGLQQIQISLRQLDEATGSDDQEIKLLQQIIDEAQSGKWTSAMKRAHAALEDQTSGS
jgi:hypothetical protein